MIRRGRRRGGNPSPNVPPSTLEALNTRFSGFTEELIATYGGNPLNSEYRFIGTDNITGQGFNATSPQLWGGQSQEDRMQYLVRSSLGLTPDQMWLREFRPGGGFRITPTANPAAPDQAAFRVYPAAGKAGQGRIAWRIDIKFDPTWPWNSGNFSFVLFEVKFEGSDDKIELGIKRESGISYLYLASWTPSNIGTPNLYGTTSGGVSTLTRGVIPAPDSYYCEPGGWNEIMFSKGVPVADSAGASPTLNEWWTFEIELLPGDPAGNLLGTSDIRPFIWVGSAKGDATNPATRGTCATRFLHYGPNIHRTLSDGAWAVFVFNYYTDAPCANKWVEYRAAQLDSVAFADMSAHRPINQTRYENLYNETFSYLQGNTTPNGVQDSATARTNLGRSDAVALQWKWPAAHSAETTYMGQLSTQWPHLVKLMYSDPRFIVDSDAGGGGTTTMNQTVVSSPGAPARWKAEDASNNWLAHRFRPNDSRALNPTDLTSTNTAGDTFHVAWMKELESYFQFDLYDGLMIDDCNMIGNNFCVYGNSTEVSSDYLNNGTTPNFKSDATAKADWAAGMNAIATTFRARHPGKPLNRNTDPAFWYRQTDAEGCPARPFSSHPYYAGDDISACEGLFEFAGGLSEFDRTDQVYPIKSFFSFANIFLAFELYRQLCRPAETNYMRRQVAFAHGNLSINSTDAPSTLTYAMARARWAMGKLCDGGFATSRNGSMPFKLDEQCIDLGGAPTTTTTMITLDQSSAPVVVTLRTENANVSGAKLYWVEYPDALVYARLDLVGLTPGSSNFGDGSAVTFNLPSAGAGYRWDAFNAATYKHPLFPARFTMEGQDTALNNGATNLTTISVKPIHGGALRRVKT